MSLQGDIKQFELFGTIGQNNMQGALSIETRLPVDLSPVLLRGTAGRGVIALLIRASANFILSSNDTTLASHE